MELFLAVQGILQQLGAEGCTSPAAAQHFSRAPMGQSGYSGCPRHTAANPQGDREHLKGNADMFALTASLYGGSGRTSGRQLNNCVVNISAEC